jgi:hypothetical protein
MKIIIKENKLEQIIYNNINMMVDTDDIHWRHPYEYDEDGYENENPNMMEFYYGDWDGYDNTYFVFDYFKPEYYVDEPSSKHNKSISPILEIRDENLEEKLTSMFGHLWQDVFKKWFEDTYGLPVKTISYYFEK